MNLNQSLITNLTNLLTTIGSFQLEHFRVDIQGNEIEKKANEFVTKIDIESENRIFESLHKMYPHIGFYGEESGKKNITEWMWVVDPIDGTNNFISGIDQFSISIALQHNQETVVGLIYKPFSGEIYHAIKGQGAFYNSKPLKKHHSFAFKNALIGTGFPYRSMETYDEFSASLKDCLLNARGVRRLGSAALDLSLLAAGNIQGFWEVALEPYDVAAAILLLEETGTLFSSFSGEKYNCHKHKTIVAGLPDTYEYLLKIVQKNYKMKPE